MMDCFQTQLSISTCATSPSLGQVFTALGADGQPTNEYVEGNLLNMTMIEAADANGRAVQVDPIKLTLKVHGTKRLETEI
jgi:hypothetical protein